MKRIGILVQSFPVPSETFIVTKVIGLIDKGFDVEIFSVSASPHWNKFANLKGRENLKEKINVSDLSNRKNILRLIFITSGHIIQKLFSHPAELLRITGYAWRSSGKNKLTFINQFLYLLMFAGKKLDVIHIEFDAQAYGKADLKDYFRCKLVLSSRGAIRRTSVLKNYPEFYPYVFSHVDHYHFISRYLHQVALKEGLAATVPVSLIEPAIDLSLFSPQEKSSGREGIILITIARLSWAKGYEFALDAVARIAREVPSVQYWILGDGPYRDAIHFAAHQLGLVSQGIVHFKGEISREEVVTCLGQADIMIHPALEEGFCNAVIEGQAMELPVICSDAGGLPENVEDNRTGFVVPQRDAAAICEKVMHLINNPDARRLMGREGRKRALARFNIQDQINKFADLYSSL